jgi:hypothetical protein
MNIEKKKNIYVVHLSLIDLKNKTLKTLKLKNYFETHFIS